MNLSKYFLEQGHLKKTVSTLSSIIGVVSAIGTVFFLDDLSDWRPWLLALLAIVFGYGSAWAGLMKKWGFSPFTNDPLGWRKAKKTYKNEEESAAPTDKDSQL